MTLTPSPKATFALPCSVLPNDLLGERRCVLILERDDRLSVSIYYYCYYFPLHLARLSLEINSCFVFVLRGVIGLLFLPITIAVFGFLFNECMYLDR